MANDTAFPFRGDTKLVFELRLVYVRKAKVNIRKGIL